MQVVCDRHHWRPNGYNRSGFKNGAYDKDKLAPPVLFLRDLKMMDNPALYTQPEKFLELLLAYLACPLGHKTQLIPVRNNTGQVIAIRSNDREYQVINNVPCMIPEVGEKKKGAFNRWEKLLTNWWQAFGSQPEDEPSVEDDPVAGYIGNMIGRSGGGLFLDVGCGTTSLPPTMEACKDTVKWIGIDPVIGEGVRRFPFLQGLGEYLPFRSDVFDGALFSLVLSNLLDPLQALRQTRRTLKCGGKVYIKYYVTPVDARYTIWKSMRTLGLTWPYNEFYQWAFTNRSVKTLLRKAGFAIETVILLCEICPYRQKCEDAGTEFLAVGQSA
jgi:SAM-dependent methyltransferase